MKHITCTIYLFLVTVIVQADAEFNSIKSSLNITKNSTSSPWLKRVTNPRAQAQGCWNRPWICSFGQVPPRRLCCMNRCVEIISDPLNCGFCGIRCPFTWQCCNGLCMNVNMNPFHCGKCWNRCAIGRPCVFGMCGYAQPFPPFPFPPTLPGPPFPFPLPLPPGSPTSQKKLKKE
ncbi:unnamed protein product [Amaranthus hypochondriacus]